MQGGSREEELQGNPPVRTQTEGEKVPAPGLCLAVPSTWSLFPRYSPVSPLPSRPLLSEEGVALPWAP